ncbi:MarR family winged helix-turn-helix transcriptional regulator [Kribbella kalugense]|uniref:MarR family transcriptional regulator n=1 Tax=Kribbella kalugense TaxID=2512221 RepID=A0A4R7ZMB0_9ACTN|nr:MarR family transcriptional regulator [Kribbella kalugense]TDW18983.1 MarR family transcriptional regulator [Kribbella kalugense]
MATERPDLAAMLYPLVRKLIAIEMPVLATHNVSMWGYSVLTALDDTPVRTQAALAEAIGADKSRIIGTLDELQQAGLIERTPDPDDRRVRLLSITTEGRRVRRAVRRGIQAQEQQVLESLPLVDRKTFIRILQQLHASR